MSAETKFKCDLCRNEIKSDAFCKKEAFALKWFGAKNNALTTQGASPYRDAPIHLCITCVSAVAKWERERT